MFKFARFFMLMFITGTLAAQENLIPDADFKEIKDIIKSKVSDKNWYSLRNNSKALFPGIVRQEQAAYAAIRPDTGIVRDIPEFQPGIYELTLEAKGKGEIYISAPGTERTMALDDKWLKYSLAFEQKTNARCRIKIMLPEDSEELSVKNIVLKKADAELSDAWKKQEEAFVAFGYVPSHLSAQRPAPEVTGQSINHTADIPKEMTQKIIFCDNRYDTNWVKNIDSIYSFFVARDFKKMNAEELLDWMKNVTEKQKAYGTVCMFPGGVIPASILKYGQNKSCFKFINLKKSLLRKYMNAGGRVIWMGDATLYAIQDSSGPVTGSKNHQQDIAGIETSQKIFYGINKSPSITEQGKKWGLKSFYACERPVDLNSVTISFTGIPSGNASQIFLKTLNPHYPLSGLISFPMQIEGKNQALLNDIYRLSLYLGTEVKVPEINMPAEKKKEIELSNIMKRSVFMRGEDILMDIEVVNNSTQAISCKLAYALTFNGKTLSDGQKNIEISQNAKTSVSEIFGTKKLAVGDYNLQISLQKDNQEILSESFPLYIRTVSDNPFFYAAWANIPKNTYRAESMLEELKERYMEPLGHGNSEIILKHGMRFSGKIEGDGGFPRELPEKQNPELLLRDAKSNTLTGIWRPGEKMAGLIHQEIRNKRAESTGKQILAYEAPNLYPWFVTNDDFSPFYIIDWSDNAKKLFKQKTGLDAPVQESCKDSVVPENDPWFSWYLFSLYDVVGGHDQAIRKAKDRVCPGGRIGPVPGGMQMPLWNRAMYPPAQFGNGRFDLISYYYYLMYWQPSIGILFWDEVARMNNPDLPLWCTTDCYITNESSYYRNNFFLHLAGGVNGLNYYHYVDAKNNSPIGWGELKKTGEVVNKFGKLIYNLKAAPKKTALFLPLATAAYNTGYPFRALFAYSNLLAAHIDIKPICREEILAGELCKYDTVLLYNAKKISAPVWDLLKNYINNGGKVFIDKLSAVDIPGAQRLDIDIAMGSLPSIPNKDDLRYGRPGIADYLIPERVDLVRNALPQLAGIPYDADSKELVIRAFEVDGVKYLWLVNIHTHEEYNFLNLKQGTGRIQEDPEESEKEAFEFLKARGVYDKMFTSEITLPAGTYKVCDILKGKELETSTTNNGRKKCSVSMERLGGTLLAFYPELPGKIDIAAKEIKQGENASIKIEVKDSSGKMMKGIVPVEIKIFYPDGKEAPYSKYDIARNGTLSVDVIPAINEPSGEWKIEVKELATGVKQASPFNVKE